MRQRRLVDARRAEGLAVERLHAEPAIRHPDDAAARNHAGVEAADLVRLQTDDALHAVDDQVIELYVPARAVARADRDRNGEPEAVERLAALLVRVESTDRHLVAVRRV